MTGQPTPTTELENCRRRLDQAVEKAAKDVKFPKAATTLAGAWQWVWYPLEDAGYSARVEVLATPDDDGVQVAVYALAWKDNSPRQVKRRTYYSHFYRQRLDDPDDVAREIQDPLRKAFQEVKDFTF